MANQTGIFHRVVTNQRTELINRNLQWLRQAHNLLQSIDDRTFGTISPPMQLLDFYERFLAGLDSGHIDYDSSGRQTYTGCKATRRAISVRFSAIICRFKSCVQSSECTTLWIRPLGSGRRRFPQPLLVSSVNRELDFLCSQAVHGLTLIAIAVQHAGAARKSDAEAQAA